MATPINTLQSPVDKSSNSVKQKLAQSINMKRQQTLINANETTKSAPHIPINRIVSLPSPITPPHFHGFPPPLNNQQFLMPPHPAPSAHHPFRHFPQQHPPSSSSPMIQNPPPHLVNLQPFEGSSSSNSPGGTARIPLVHHQHPSKIMTVPPPAAMGMIPAQHPVMLMPFFQTIAHPASLSSFKGLHPPPSLSVNHAVHWSNSNYNNNNNHVAQSIHIPSGIPTHILRQHHEKTLSSIRTPQQSKNTSTDSNLVDSNSHEITDNGKNVDIHKNKTRGNSSSNKKSSYKPSNKNSSSAILMMNFSEKRDHQNYNQDTEKPLRKKQKIENSFYLTHKNGYSSSTDVDISKNMKNGRYKRRNEELEMNELGTERNIDVFGEYPDSFELITAKTSKKKREEKKIKVPSSSLLSLESPAVSSSGGKKEKQKYTEGSATPKKHNKQMKSNGHLYKTVNDSELNFCKLSSESLNNKKKLSRREQKIIEPQLMSFENGDINNIQKEDVNKHLFEVKKKNEREKSFSLLLLAAEQLLQ